MILLITSSLPVSSYLRGNTAERRNAESPAPSACRRYLVRRLQRANDELADRRRPTASDGPSSDGDRRPAPVVVNPVRWLAPAAGSPDLESWRSWRGRISAAVIAFIGSTRRPNMRRPTVVLACSSLAGRKLTSNNVGDVDACDDAARDGSSASLSGLGGRGSAACRCCRVRRSPTTTPAGRAAISSFA